MMKKVVVVSVLALVFSQLLLSPSHADNAEVLPKGVKRLSVDSNFYLPIDERYDPDGDTEDAATDFNATLDRSVFEDLGDLEDFFNAYLPGSLPGGIATIGNSIVSFEYDVTIVELSFQYGITDRLTAGIMIPYWKVENDVSAKVDTSNATLGFNPAFDPSKSFDPMDMTTFQLIPVSLGGIQDDAAATELAQHSLAELGYERFETWDDDGISDIEAGLRYQYLKTENWRLAFTGGVRFPTGEVDDPDNLVDRGFGSGAWALLFHLNQDYVGIKNLVLNGTVRYELYLPDKEKLRVPEDVNRPITANKEKVDRDFGDVIELETSGIYEFAEGFKVSLLYRYGFSFEDDVSGDEGFPYESLEDETEQTEHVVMAGLSYSTLPLFMAKRFPVPLEASLSYRNRFAGSNNVFKSEYIGLQLAVYF
jgi:hypothetical protein